MVDTKATINLDGSGSLGKYLQDLQKSMGDLNKVTTDQTKGFEKLNKTGTDTGSFVGDLLKDVKELVSTGKDLTKGTKDTFSFLTSTAENTIKLNDALDESTTGLAGFGLKLVGLKDDFSRLNSVIDKPAGHFRDIAEAEGMTAKAFVILDKTSKPIISGLNILSNQLEKAERGFRNAEVYVAGFAQTLASTGARSLQFFSMTFDNLSKNMASSGLVGRLVAGTFSGVSKSLEDGAKSAEKFSASIDPAQFSKVDMIGNQLASSFDTVGKNVDRLAVGVKLADAVGDLTRFATGIKDSGEALKEDLTTGVNQASAAVKFGLPLYMQMNNRLQIITTIAKTLSMITGNQLAGAVGLLGTKIGQLTVASGTFITLGKAMSDAYIQSRGLTDTFDVMQRLGVDTTAASIAFQFGIVGEKLLFSSQAAKEFAKTTITAFAGLEDAAAFVTTLGAGSTLQIEGFEAGIESVAASMTKLVNGPLKNTITSLDATNALYNALSAGIGIAKDGTVQMGEANEFLAASLKLSAGTGSDSAQTLELLAKASKVYGISNAEASETAAKLYQIVEQGVVTFPQLTGSLGRTLSVAKATGVGIDEAAGSIAALTKVMSADDAQTGLASLLQSIAGQGEQAQNALKELGIRFDVNSIKSKGLIQSLNDLYVATGGNASALKEIIPDALGFQTALTLMTSASKDAAATTKLVSESSGEMLDNVFEKRQQSTVKQFSMIMNGFNEVLVDFGQRALPAIGPGVDFLEMLLGVLQNLPGPLKTAIGFIVLAQTAISNIGGGLLSLGLTIGQIVASIVAFRLVGKVISGIGNNFKDLRKEAQVLQDINSDGVDFGATLLRLVGLYENFDASTAHATATLKKQREVMKGFKDTGLDFDGDISTTQDLNDALKKVRKEISDTRTAINSTNQVTDAFDAARQTVQASVGITIKDLSDAELNKALSGIENKIQDLASDASASLELGDIVKVDGIADEIKGLENLKDRLVEIKQVKESLEASGDFVVAKDSESQVKKLEKLEAKIVALKKTLGKSQQSLFKELQEGIDNDLTNVELTLDQKKAKLKNRLENYFTTFGETGQVYKAEIANVFDNILSNQALSPEDKIAEINATFERLGQDVSPEVRKNFNKVRVELVEASKKLDGVFKGEIQETLYRAKESFSNMVPDSVKAQMRESFDSIGTILGDGAKQAQEKMSSILGNTDIDLSAKLGQLEVLFASFGDKVPDTLKVKLEAAKQTIINSVREIEDPLGVAIEGVNKRFGSINDRLSEVMSSTKLTAQQKIAEINVIFEQLTAYAPESIKDNIEKARQSVISGLDKLKTATSSVSISDLKEQFVVEVDKLKTVLGNSFDSASTVAKTQLDKFRTTISSGLETTLASATLGFQDKKQILSAELSKYFDTFGEKGSEYKVKVSEAFDQILSNTKTSIDEKIVLINESLSKIGEFADESISPEIQKIKESIVSGLQQAKEKTVSFKDTFVNLVPQEAIQEVSAKLDSLKDVVGANSDTIKLKMESILDDSKTNLATKLEQIEVLFEQLGPEVSSKLDVVRDVVKSNFNKLDFPIKEKLEQAGIEFEGFKFLVETVLIDTTASVEEKISKISSIYSEVTKDAPEKFKASLEEGKAALVASLDNLREPIRNGVAQAAGGFEIITQVLDETKTSVGEKIDQINLVFKDLISNAPASARESLERTRDSLIEGLTNLKTATGELEIIDADSIKVNAEKIKTVVTESLSELAEKTKGKATEIRTNLESMISPQTAEVTSQALVVYDEKVSTALVKTKAKAEEVSLDTNKALGSLGSDEVVGKVSKSMGSLADLIGMFDPRVERAYAVFSNFKNVLQDMDLDVGKLTKGKWKLFGANKATESASKALMVVNQAELATSQALVATNTAEAVSENVVAVSKRKGAASSGLAALATKTLDWFKKELTFTNKGLTLSEVFFGKTIAANNVNMLANLSLTKMLTVAKMGLSKALLFAGKAWAFLAQGFGTLFAMIAPLLAKLVILGAAIVLVHNVLKAIIPAYARLTDANARLADSMGKTSEKVAETTEKIRGMTESIAELQALDPTDLSTFTQTGGEEDLAMLSTKAIQNLTGATDEEVKELRRKVLEASIPEEKSFIQGWRKPLIGLGEAITNFLLKTGFAIINTVESTFRGSVKLFSGILGNLPVVGKFFKDLSKGTEDFRFQLEMAEKETLKRSRNIFNRIRDGIQGGLAAGARMAAVEGLEETQALMLETRKLTKAYEDGGVAFSENKTLMAQAAKEQRALSAEEMQKLLADEQKLADMARSEIQEKIELKQKELEDAKDPEVKRILQTEIDMLQQRNTEIENGSKVQQKYVQNINEILSARDTNDAALGGEQLLKRTQQIYDTLSEEAKATFAEINGIAVDSEGKVTGIAGNLVNSSQRRASAAFQGATSAFTQTLEDIDDPTKGINGDKIASDLFNVLESVDNQVAEGVIDFEAGEKIKEYYSNMEVEIVDAQGNIQKATAKTLLRPNDLKELENNQLEGIRNVAKRSIEIKEAELTKIKALEGQNLVTAVDSARAQEQINAEVGESKIEAEEKVLARLIKNQGESSEAAKAQARVVEQLKLDVALQGFNDRKKVLDEEFNLLQRQKENEIKKIELVAEKEKSAMDLRIKSMNLEQQARQASQDLSVAIANLEATTLQNKLKFTGDIVDKAKIELQLTQDRQVALAAEQEFELQNLELQQELNKLGLEREKIELRVQAAQLNSQKILAQAKLDQADALNLTEEERTALQLQVDALNQQIGLNGQQQAQLVKQGETQEQINEKQREGLLIRQEGARQTSAADVDLAKLELVNAGYERQKEILRNNAREVEMSGEERLQNLKEQETLLNSQTTVIQKQLDIVKQTQDISQRFFDIAKSSARSGFIQRRIEKEAAQERLKNLESVQKMEQVNLQIQQQQRDLALVRKEIELEVAEAKQVASLAEAQAEQARIEADPRSTEEQKRAAALGVIAQETGLRAIGSQREALGIEKALNDFVNMTEQQQQQREFGLQTLEAEQAVASTTRVRTDDRRIGTRALAIGRESADQVESLLQQFQGNNQLIPINTSGAVTLPTLQNSGGRTQSIVDTMGGSGSTASLNQNQGTMNQIGGKVEVVLEIKGDAAKLDKEALQKAASDGLYEGLNKLFDYSLNRKQ